MKLRNKETPNILGKIAFVSGEDGSIAVKTDQGVVWYYNSLDKLNEEWEDEPEEPKMYWCVNGNAEIISMRTDWESPETTEACKQIGNYFGTREEAELAVRKLKAWKRLKDKGFRFRKWDWLPDQNIICGNIGFYIKDYNVDTDDLGLLFGGEE